MLMSRDELVVEIYDSGMFEWDPCATATRHDKSLKREFLNGSDQKRIPTAVMLTDFVAW